MASPLKAKLWKIFSLYIRLRDADGQGNCRCISCGRIKRWNDCDAGHFIPKNKGNAVYFDENNVHAQCRHCNSFLHGNLGDYRVNLEKKIGRQRVNLISYKEIKKYSEFEYEMLIKHYKQEVKELKKVKVCE
jgi:hypothetical protein